MTNRSGQPLVFTTNYPPRGATEGNCVRPLKWEVDASDNAGTGFANDFAFFRLAEISLIKAEALWRLNGPNQQSLDLINLIRERAFEPDQPVSMAEASQMGWKELFLEARLRELHGEMKRRQDLIRFGRFTSDSWAHKEPSEPWRVVFPIPQAQLNANPNLTQNPAIRERCGDSKDGQIRKHG